MRQRRLSDAEIHYAGEIFGNNLDYNAVRITRGSVLALFSATSTGNRINFQSHHFAGDSLALSDAGMLVLIHELTHVWQFQQAGYGYIFSSLSAQICAWVKTGSRRGAYDWRKPWRRNVPWAQWNAEQQAQCIGDYNAAIRATHREDGESIATLHAIVRAALDESVSRNR